MRIEKIEKKVWGPSGKTTKVTYQDNETDRIYGRIISGIGWPWAEREGAVLTVAEMYERDHSLPHSPRHCYVLDEFYSSDLEELHRCCGKARDKLCAQSVVGDPHSSLNELWRNLGDSAPTIYISKPPSFENIDLNFSSQLVRKRTSIQKTLHIGEGRMLPGFLSTLREEEIEGKSLQSFPAIAALAFTLAVMEGQLTTGTWIPTRKRTPRNLRYRR
jgi:hypothetical protein